MISSVSANTLVEYDNHYKLKNNGVSIKLPKRIDFSKFTITTNINKTKSYLNIAKLKYTCSSRKDNSLKCLGGLSDINSKGLQTRCYNPLKSGWKYCSTGWKLV